VTNKEKMLEFVTQRADGRHGDTRAGVGWLVLQRKYFYENADVLLMKQLTRLRKWTGMAPFAFSPWAMATLTTL